MAPIALLSFEVFGEAWPGRVKFHEFAGEFPGAETPTWFGYERCHLEGISAEKFFEILLTAHHEGLNKIVVTATLNTWFWVAVVGQNGRMRGKPRLFRHTLPTEVDGSRGESALWALVADREYTGPKTRYELVPYPRTPRVYGYECWDNGCRAGILVPADHPVTSAKEVTDELLLEAHQNGVVNTSHPSFDWGRNVEDYPAVQIGGGGTLSHRVILLKKGGPGSGVSFSDIFRERGLTPATRR